jgi:hypothetical protein
VSKNDTFDPYYVAGYVPSLPNQASQGKSRQANPHSQGKPRKPRKPRKPSSKHNHKPSHASQPRGGIRGEHPFKKKMILCYGGRGKNEFLLVWGEKVEVFINSLKVKK